jgi:Mg2+-importing ATPase
VEGASVSSTRPEAPTGPSGLLSSPIEDALARLGTSRDGLPQAEAERRLETYGRNELVTRERNPFWYELLLKFRNPLVIILMLASIASGVLGDWVDCAIIIAIVMMSVMLELLQERRAVSAVEALRARVAVTASVLRDGTKREVPLVYVVPGDVVLLAAGDMIPADSRVLEANDLVVDQSPLTGESFPVEKTVEPPEARDATVTEWPNALFMGTSVLSGAARAVILTTGSSTQYGSIARKLIARRAATEFDKGLRSFGTLVMRVTVVMVVSVFLISAVHHRNLLSSLLFSIALAVGLTPELLPMIVTVNLSRGALAMSEKGVIVKRLSSIQNLGSMDVLCTDKTGTLTENRITLASHTDLYGNEDERSLILGYVNSALQAGLRNPLDEAILAHTEVDVSSYKRVDEVPFDFDRRRVSVVVDRGPERLLVTKGAAEEVLRASTMCEIGGNALAIDDDLRNRLHGEQEQLSMDGYRVLAVAFKRVDPRAGSFSVEDESGLTFVGFLAFLDPPKADVREALQLLQQAKVEVKVITGDNELVTRAVCTKLGFEVRGIVLGKEIEGMRDEELLKAVEAANIFARVTPAQKNRVITALRTNGHVVGYLGDGINDAPSLRTADVGISVDNAAEVAKVAADIILLKKSLLVLRDGVLEGRRSFGNTMKYIMMGTSSNFGTMSTVAVSSAFLNFLPMLPTQILLNNLLYDVSELTIPLDDVDVDYLRSPRRLDIALIRKFMLLLGPISSVFDFLTFGVLLYVLSTRPDVFRTAWFVESLCTQAMVIFVIRTRVSPFYRSRPSWALVASSLAIVALALILPVTPVGVLFKLVPPPALFYPFLVGVVVAYLVTVELVKAWFYRRYAASAVTAA